MLEILTEIFMKKLKGKDLKLRLNIKTIEKKQFILKLIFKNLNFFNLLRWKAFLKLKNLAKKNSKVSISNICVKTVNKSRINSTIFFSRYIFLKLIRFGKISGVRKSCW